MIKIDIVKRVADHLHLKDGEALAVVDAILDSLKESICEHGRLEIRDFGVFQTKLRKPRTGRNPRNRKEYPIPPRRVVTFKLGKELKDFSTSRPAALNRIETAKSPASSSAGAPQTAAVNQDTFLPSDSE
jgi:nucleoid DNA-binding protein